MFIGRREKRNEFPVQHKKRKLVPSTDKEKKAQKETPWIRAEEEVMNDST